MGFLDIFDPEPNASGTDPFDGFSGPELPEPAEPVRFTIESPLAGKLGSFELPAEPAADPEPVAVPLEVLALRGKYRDAHCRGDDRAEPGSPVYEARGRLFDKRDSELQSARGEDTAPSAPPTGQGAGRSSSSAQPAKPEVASAAAPKPSGLLPALADSGLRSCPEPPGAGPRGNLATLGAAPPPTAKLSTGKRPYQRVGTADLQTIALSGGPNSQFTDQRPDPVGVTSELAWRHKPAAFRVAAALGCKAGTRSYPGSARG